MPSVYDIKPRFQGLLRPLLAIFARTGIHPNHLTVAALLGSIAVGGAILLAPYQPLWLLALPVWLFARMALNALDGMLAREHGMSTRLGAVLNELGDVLSDLALYLPLAAVRTDAAWPVVAFCLAAVLTEFAGVLSQALGARRHYQGPMGKSDRALLVGTLALLAVLAPATLASWSWVFAAAALLAGWTCRNRLSAALRELREMETSS